jgi:ABC-type glycerol-3-phosphate transport system permease component
MMRFVVLAGMAGIVLTLRGSDYLADARPELFAKLHGLVLMKGVYGLAFSILLYRSSIFTIVRELDEASIDVILTSFGRSR